MEVKVEMESRKRRMKKKKGKEKEKEEEEVPIEIFIEDQNLKNSCRHHLLQPSTTAIVRVSFLTNDNMISIILVGHPKNFVFQHLCLSALMNKGNHSFEELDLPPSLTVIGVSSFPLFASLSLLATTGHHLLLMTILSLQFIIVSHCRPPSVTNGNLVPEICRCLPLVDDNSERLINNNNASSTGDILSINDDVVDKPTNASTENNIVVPQPAELMGLHDLLTGASEFEEKSLAMTFIPSELGWEVALFTEPENYNGNITTEMENNREKVGGMELWKDDDEMNGETEESVSEFSRKVRLNPFDMEGSHHHHHHHEQFNMASPNSLPNIPYQMGDMHYQHLVQQPRKTVNPFDETNIFPSTVPSHPTQTR
ncbi:hypothetical protein V8G54_008879 [Vigna mungo]|uniref:Uncharacterized protein n=1 Tax=Vigna mungo TaxID=3915 RepID=A0AAQ3S8N1_VIGMU